MPKPDYIRCILDERATNERIRAPGGTLSPGATLCEKSVKVLYINTTDDRAVYESTWTLEHVFNSVRSGSRFLPCPDCARVVIKAMGG